MYKNTKRTFTNHLQIDPRISKNSRVNNNNKMETKNTHMYIMFKLQKTKDRENPERNQKGKDALVERNKR